MCVCVCVCVCVCGAGMHGAGLRHRSEQALSALLEVAVGVLERADGRCLLAQRPAGKPYAGWWEFPGGKCEPGESIDRALARELHEELGIDITASLPWVVREHAYPHAHVRLHFRRVRDWSGAPVGREGQRFVWCNPAAVDVEPLLPASVPVLRWLGLPPVYAISDAAGLGETGFLARLVRALGAGLRMVQLREPQWPPARVEALFERVLAATRAADARLLVSSRHAPQLWRAADGVHLTARDLHACAERPDAALVAASCHVAGDLERAGALGADFAVLGPVAETVSHPGAGGLGWAGFQALARLTPVPVYALGGMRAEDLAPARRSGAHGVAMQRAAWA